MYFYLGEEANRYFKTIFTTNVNTRKLGLGFRSSRLSQSNEHTSSLRQTHAKQQFLSSNFLMAAQPHTEKEEPLPASASYRFTVGVDDSDGCVAARANQMSLWRFLKEGRN